MKNIVKEVLAVVMTSVVLCLTACGEKPSSEISSSSAQTKILLGMRTSPDCTLNF